MAKIDTYKDIKLEQLKEIDKYFQMFAYYFENDGRLTLGWIYQIYRSIQPGHFVFKSAAFETKNIQDTDPGDIFEDKRHQWDKPFVGNRYDSFIKGLTNKQAALPKSSQKANTLKEKLLAHMYNAIKIAQKS